MEVTIKKYLPVVHSRNHFCFIGAVYDFSFNGGKWTENSIFYSEALQKEDLFGYSLSFSENTAVIGAPARNNRTGSAFVFRRNAVGEKWNEVVELTSAVSTAGVMFGLNTVIDNSIVAISSPFFSKGEEMDVGGAVIFEEVSGKWVETAFLVPSKANELSMCGSSGLAIQGNTLWMGCSSDTLDADLKGSVYVFVRDAMTGAWSEKDRLIPSSKEPFQFFGSAIAVHGNILAVGANGVSTTKAEWSGAVSLFTFDPSTGSNYKEITRLMPALDDITVSAAYYYYYGSSIAVTDNRVVVGAYGDASAHAGDYTGAAYIYSYDPTTFPTTATVTLESKVTRSTPVILDRVGRFVTASGSNALLSADGVDLAGLKDAGAALFVPL
jgi:hypothetical protein